MSTRLPSTQLQRVNDERSTQLLSTQLQRVNDERSTRRIGNASNTPLLVNFTCFTSKLISENNLESLRNFTESVILTIKNSNASEHFNAIFAYAAPPQQLEGGILKFSNNDLLYAKKRAVNNKIWNSGELAFVLCTATECLSICMLEGLSCYDSSTHLIYINYDNWTCKTNACNNAAGEDASEITDAIKKQRYQSYVILHELGHAMGLEHPKCGNTGIYSPIMIQQTLGLCKGHKANWQRYLKEEVAGAFNEVAGAFNEVA
jgi:hypothetical protein